MGNSSSKTKAAPPNEAPQENDARQGHQESRRQTESPIRTESRPTPVNTKPAADLPQAGKSPVPAPPISTEKGTPPQETSDPSSSPPVSVEGKTAAPQREDPPMPRIGPGDTVIVVMGLTGVGKSTFISYYSDKAIVGRSLRSCTTEVSIHPARIDGKTVYLVDTPGFDDKDRTDVDILRDTASWLASAYDAQIKLAGVVYLHRIQDNRVSGTITQNIELFRQLCGANGLASVVLATTMWDMTPPDHHATLEARETELKTDDSFWGCLVNQGCTVMRQDRGADSATLILRHILGLQQPVTLLLQEEIAEGVELHQTAAGTVLTKELDEQQQRYDEEMVALRKEYEKMQEELRRVQADLSRLREEGGQTAWKNTLNKLLGEIERLRVEIDSTKRKQEQTKAELKKLKEKGLLRRFWAWLW